MAYKNYHFLKIDGRSLGYYAVLAVLMALLAVGGLSALFMEHSGHHVTGMNNQIVWGMPHVFAVFLIVAASGALNVASISSVFGRELYKPLSRLSGLLAIALLAGGLAVLVLDLGRPERLVVAMTYYNFKSIFAWNILLYTGFFGVVIVYLWMMFERKMNVYSKPAGLAAFLWRLILTTGTGSIFGFLVARRAYDSALYAPMFIIMSFAFGLAIFVLVMFAAYRGTDRPLGDVLVNRLRNLLGVFVAAVLYFVLVYHLTNLYITAQHDVERFILVDGGVYTRLFWIGQILAGGIIPLILLFAAPFSRSRAAFALACVLVILGGMAQMYGIIVGGQAFPLVLFPGMEVSSSFFDGAVGTYAPTPAEIGLGVGGFALALTLTALAIKVLPFLPASLADAAIDPHHKKA